jgi:hypothetical protein
MTESRYSMEFPRMPQHVFETHLDDDPQKRAKRFDIGSGEFMAILSQAQLFPSVKCSTLGGYPIQEGVANGERTGLHFPLAPTH